MIKVLQFLPCFVHQHFIWTSPFILKKYFLTRSIVEVPTPQWNVLILEDLQWWEAAFQQKTPDSMSVWFALLCINSLVYILVPFNHNSLPSGAVCRVYLTQGQCLPFCNRFLLWAVTCSDLVFEPSLWCQKEALFLVPFCQVEFTTLGSPSCWTLFLLHG